MLVLSRKPGDEIRIGDLVTVTILELKGNRIRIGISAPADVAVLRGEVADRIRRAAGVTPAHSAE